MTPRIVWTALFVFASFFWGSLACFASEGNGLAIGSGFGVQIKHERTTPEELDQIKNTGFDWVRFDMRWGAVEQKRGEYDWGVFDKFIDEVHKHNLKAIIILMEGNPVYDGMTPLPPGNAFRAKAVPTAPKNKKDFNAFAFFAAAAVARYNSEDIIWEIWNEPDLNLFWPPHTDSKAYATLASKACAAMRKANPAAKIVGPALGYMPGTPDRFEPRLLEKLLNSQAMSCLDALSVHPYRHQGRQQPESVMEDYKTLHTFIADHAPRKLKQLPVISSEWGYTLTNQSPEEQAAYVLRSYFANLMSGVPLSIWYEWRDAREGKDDPEAHFGLLELDGKPKLSQQLLQNILPKIHDATIEQRIPVQNEENYLLLLHGRIQEHYLLFWSTHEKDSDISKLQIKQGNQMVKYPLTNQPRLIDISEPLPQIEITP